MTPEHGLQAAYVRGARGRRMRPVLMAGNLVQAQLSARTDDAASAGDGRADPQPRAASVRAASGGSDRMGDGADRDRASRGPALSAAVRGARRAARRDRGSTFGARVGSGAGALRTAAAGRAWVRPRSRPLRGERQRTTIWSRSAPSPAAPSAPQRPSPMRASCCRCRRSFARAAAPRGRKSHDGLDLTGHFLMRDVLTDRSPAYRGSARPARRAVAPRGWSRLGCQLA